MLNFGDLFKNGVQSDTLTKIAIVFGVVFVIGSFLINLVGILGPFLEMHKNLNEMKITLGTAKSNIDSSRLQLDSIVKNINNCNRYIDSVKTRVELIDHALIKKSIEFTQITKEQKNELQEKDDSLRAIFKENDFGLPEEANP
jgi:hypothetical protein